MKSDIFRERKDCCRVSPWLVNQQSTLEIRRKFASLKNFPPGVFNAIMAFKSKIPAQFQPNLFSTQTSQIALEKLLYQFHGESEWKGASRKKSRFIIEIISFSFLFFSFLSRCLGRKSQVALNRTRAFFLLFFAISKSFPNFLITFNLKRGSRSQFYNNR